MLLGRVIGTVVATQKDPNLLSFKLQLVRRVDLEARDESGFVVAVDAVGAGVGDIVIYATGSSARQTDLTRDKPVDAVLVGIVDTWDVEGEIKYRKYPGDAGTKSEEVGV
ncbi:unnamed protein product [marine sediment metagenome]|uniref:Ethanolamine utilization protein EutN n=1 Tax=marine sediment metagenome TaxID=412755 RepID=X0S697_9ZZZZ